MATRLLRSGNSFQQALKRMSLCPCDSGLQLTACCGPYLTGALAPTAEALMRSRYTAYTLLDEAYLLATWHASTRPAILGIAHETPRPQWLGLKIRRHQLQDNTHATVEFVARHKVAGRAYRMHELSQFVLENGRWFYVTGKLIKS